MTIDNCNTAAKFPLDVDVAVKPCLYLKFDINNFFFVVR